jgi:predicted dithiol-disulfide oxidoreductase (DUF899 family)
MANRISKRSSDGCRQLIVYHFMFDPSWDKGCPGCTGFVDAAEGSRHDVRGIFSREHGLSVFFRLDDDIFHTYSAYACGTESVTDAYRLLDTTPYGRQQDFEESPAGWPQKPTYG